MHPAEPTALGTAVQELCDSLGLKYSTGGDTHYRPCWRIYQNQHWFCTIFTYDNVIHLVGRPSRIAVSHLADPQLINKLRQELCALLSQQH